MTEEKMKSLTTIRIWSSRLLLVVFLAICCILTDATHFSSKGCCTDNSLSVQKQSIHTHEFLLVDRGGGRWRRNRGKQQKTEQKSIQQQQRQEQQQQLVSSSKSSTNGITLSQRQLQLSALIAATVATSLLLYSKRAVWLPFTKKEYIQERTLSILHKLQPHDVDDHRAVLKAHLTYMLGMAFWELIGMSTIPVETAAAMVFGWQALIFSLAGKLLGASTAFWLGRTSLQTAVVSQLKHNAIFAQLMTTTTTATTTTTDSNRSPLQTAFLMKFSCFPEFVKNCGSSVLPVIKFWMFVLATLFHGGMFTATWTWLGVDTAARLENPHLPSNRPLQVTLAVTFGFVGFVFTPAIMTWWIRDLQKKASLSEESNIK